MRYKEEKNRPKCATFSARVFHILHPPKNRTRYAVFYRICCKCGVVVANEIRILDKNVGIVYGPLLGIRAAFVPKRIRPMAQRWICTHVHTRTRIDLSLTRPNANLARVPDATARRNPHEPDCTAIRGPRGRIIKPIVLCRRDASDKSPPDGGLYDADVHEHALVAYTMGCALPD